MNTVVSNDKIIKEIPVYLSDDLRHLILLHYPTRLSRNDQLLSSSVTQCKYKQECEEIDISYALDTDLNYDKGHGQELAADVGGSNSKEKSTYPSGMIDQLSFESHNISSSSTDMIMFASGKSLHLCPLKKNLNMLPKLSYIDKIDPKNDKINGTQEQNEEEEDEEESEQIMAKFKDRPGRKSEKKKMQEMVKQRAMEPWINLNYVPNGQYFSRTELDKFMQPKSSSSTNKNADSDNSKKGTNLLNEDINPIRSRQLSHSMIKHYSLENKLKILVFNTKMISSQKLLELLKECGVLADENFSSIFEPLKKIALLVRGNWIVKSEILYPENTTSAHFGLSFETMRYLRDYIIYMLDSNQKINRKIIKDMFNAPPDEVYDAITSVAILDETKTWKFLATSCEDVKDLIEDYNIFIKEQKEWWTVRIKQINTWLEHKSKKA
ncbi:DNA-directed RNA polymerase III subunit RPC5 isoform X2 [Daktulosphaira vitifoliae]|uniref:DNA-directed RNA polymerase III subunit RPC5 isoform X2 n=1 Tax=Daktulosphaira vitifoliae TaxID=58002 RepID=UPI0021AA577F|nr:DNA-directed RNA polymerase III subunit RPC5 isoform X2 [Daktulosphaira vitifoliae]